MPVERAFAGLDFGTESVRAIVVDQRGLVLGSAVAPFAHGQVIAGSATAQALIDEPLSRADALQHPGDWIEAAASATREAVDNAARVVDAASGRALRVDGLGVDFTSCTVLPALADGTPLAMTPGDMGRRKHAWPKLWKHHGAASQAERMTATAVHRGEPWLDRYGGNIGLEWFFPKVWEVVEADPEVAAATEVWVEGGDWVVWQLTGAKAAGGDRDAESLIRSTCQAGYKAMWSRQAGYPDSGYFEACSPALARSVGQTLAGTFAAPGERAGDLSPAMGEMLGLPAGIAVSAAVIDAHAGVPGAGVADTGVLVMVLGTSGCHMLMSAEEHLIPGVAGVVEDGILPGSFGYETGQAAMGDAFDWVRRLCGREGFEGLERDAYGIAPGCDGLVSVDWFNGCRTPLMDGSLRGALTGLDLHHTPAHLYRSLLEASACGIRWIVETLDAGGAGVDRLVATGGLALNSRLFVEIVASVIGIPVEVCQIRHGPAVGAAVLGAVAAGAFPGPADAVSSMAGAESAAPAAVTVDPDRSVEGAYGDLYRRYRDAADWLRAGRRP